MLWKPKLKTFCTPKYKFRQRYGNKSEKKQCSAASIEMEVDKHLNKAFNKKSDPPGQNSIKPCKLIARWSYNIIIIKG